MIGYLRGKVLDHQDGKLLLGVAGSSEPDAPMVGYQVSVPQSAEYGAIVTGSRQELYIYTHVREEALDLYGFTTPVEKEVFLLLLSVNGIGPKGALSLLGQLPVEQLVDCVIRGDKDALVKTPGVGKKTAERLVLELVDPLRKKLDSGALLGISTTSRSSKPGARPGVGAATGAIAGRGVIREATEALVGLGYREPDVAPLLETLAQSLGEGARTEQLIRGALQRLG